MKDTKEFAYLRSAISCTLNALNRDAMEGKAVRKEMACELREAFGTFIDAMGRALPAPAVSEASSIGIRDLNPYIGGSPEEKAIIVAHIDQHVAAAVHARAEELARTFVRDVAAERDAALAELAALRAQVPQAGAGADDEPACVKCNGTGMVDAGEIDCYSNGEPFECGPVKCVDDCPCCGGSGKVHPAPPAAELPAQRDLPRPRAVWTGTEMQWEFGEPENAVDLYTAQQVLNYADVRLLALRQPQGEPQRPRYTCIGKGGEYELIGTAKPAGTMNLAGNMTVYRDTTSGAMYYRTPTDFVDRMELVAANQAGKEDDK